MRQFVGGAFVILLLSSAVMLTSERANAAGGAYVVDDSETVTPNTCALESWAQFASNHDFNTVTQPECGFDVGKPVEVDAALQRARSGGAWGTSSAVTAKLNLISTDKSRDNSRIGVAFEVASAWNLQAGGNTGTNVFVPVTFMINDAFHINVNGGWFHDNVNNINYATWGIGFEWDFKPVPLTLIGEVFGQAGTLPIAADGDPPSPNAIRDPRTQIGLRYKASDNADIDVIWGHNIGGENAHWVTLGLNLHY